MGEGRGIYSVAMFQKEKHRLAMLFFLGFVAVVGSSTLRY